MWDAKGVSALKFHGQSQPFSQCSVGKYAEQGRRGIQTVFGKMQRTPNIEEKRTIALQVVPVVKKKKAHLPMQEIKVGYLGWDDPLE